MSNLKPFVLLLLIISTLAGCAVTDQQNMPKVNVSTPDALYDDAYKQHIFALRDVSLNNGPFAHAQAVNVSYLLALDADRLLAPYLKEAGLKPKADNYGNWESSGLDGHIGGHYLSALSLAWAATGDEALSQRLDYMLAELSRAQGKNGYIGGIPNGEAMWQQISAGNINADLFSLNERWVPLYNIDKLFHGLRDAYVIGKRERAGALLFSLGEWMLSTTGRLSDEQIQAMLYSEHGGLNAVFTDMYGLSHDARYLALAKKFTHRSVIQPLSEGSDKLTGLHANTQIPKVIGALKVSLATGSDDWEKAATFFWQNVTQKRSVSIGGNSVREHFHATDDFTPMVEDIEGPETCNTYNMLKLSKLLFLHTGDPRYLAFYERATYNHILSSQHPEHGGLVYFTPMRPGHYRMYSSAQNSMWCCVGSGIENHSKYGELIYTKTVDNLWVNLFIASTLHWQEQGLTLTQHTRFPDDQHVSLHIDDVVSDRAGSVTLHIRQPEWLAGEMRVTVNGEPVKAEVQNGYVSFTRQFAKGDIIAFELPAAPYLEQIPDGQDYYSVMFGPVALATRITAFEGEALNTVADDSRMGHIADGPTCPPGALPVMIGDPQVFLQKIARAEQGELAFNVSSNITRGNAGDNSVTETLIPFFRLHDSRYQIYWKNLSQAGFSSFMREAKAKDDAKQALNALTIDRVQPGEQQPEVEHDFKGDNTSAGVNNGRHWRDATNWFGYTLRNPDRRKATLRITYFAGDNGRAFSIKVNGQNVASVRLPEKESVDAFYTVDSPLPANLADQPTLSLVFEAEEGSVAGGIYGIRLIDAK